MDSGVEKSCSCVPFRYAWIRRLERIPLNIISDERLLVIFARAAAWISCKSLVSSRSGLASAKMCRVAMMESACNWVSSE